MNNQNTGVKVRIKMIGRRIAMKKIISIIVLLTVAFCMAACGNSNNDKEADIPAKEEVYSIGDTVSTDCMECTLISVEKEGQYIHATYSIKNIGKNSLSDAWIYTPESVTRKVGGLSSLDYNDGYTYDQHATGSGSSVTLIDLAPLSDAVSADDVFINVPDEVWDNEPASLLVKIYLYSETENESAEIDESWPDLTKDAAKHTQIFTFKVR